MRTFCDEFYPERYVIRVTPPRGVRYPSNFGVGYPKSFGYRVDLWYLDTNVGVAKIVHVAAGEMPSLSSRYYES